MRRLLLFILFGACSFQTAVAESLDIFGSPDEISIIGASLHGKDKHGYKFNSIHPGLSISGIMYGDPTLRWQAGYVTKDSYGCEMYFGGGSWFPYASGNRDDFIVFGVSLVIASKCLSPDNTRHLVLLPLPTVRFSPYHHVGIEGVFSPKVRGDTVWFVAMQIRYTTK